jgi:pimeloyl-ACP methyl ester carboxylesterase
VPVEIYYPSQTAGEDVPVATGQFPVISFGHGFVMAVTSYTNFCDILVPEGYILALSNTETGISPSHQDLALDLSFILHAFAVENADPGSLFFGSIATMNAVMGHSMGGGASMLATAGDTIVKSVVNFAAANTSPSAIEAATGIAVPALLFSGSEDCVAPPQEHQVPMYDSLASVCKTWIDITGGGHCYFANDNFLCTFGENSCSPNLTITREEQQDITFDFLLPWLDYFLKGEQQSWEVFADSLASSQRMTYEQDCEMTGIWQIESGKSNIKAYPIPFKDYLIIDFEMDSRKMEIFDLSGRRVMQFPLYGSFPITIKTGYLQPGIYQFIITGTGGEKSEFKAFKF